MRRALHDLDLQLVYRTLPRDQFMAICNDMSMMRVGRKSVGQGLVQYRLGSGVLQPL